MGYKCYYFNSSNSDFTPMEIEMERRFEIQGRGNIENDQGLMEQKWKACFAHAVLDGVNKGIHVAFNISADYKTKFLDSTMFEERVNFWINEGKAMGLLFDDLKWKLYKSSNDCDWLVQEGKMSNTVPGRALMFYLPTGKMSTTKEMHLHLFFLRLLYEKHATIDRYIELRQKLAKSHPFISRIGTLIMAELTCGEAKNIAGTRWYATGSHPFLSNKSLKCVVLSANGLFPDNLLEWFNKTMGGGGKSFDHNFIGPSRRIVFGLDYYTTSYADPIDHMHSKSGIDSALALIAEEYIKELNNVRKDEANPVGV